MSLRTMNHRLHDTTVTRQPADRIQPIGRHNQALSPHMIIAGPSHTIRLGRPACLWLHAVKPAAITPR